MTIRVVRLGSDRLAGEGLRIGTVRRPPRGVRKADFASRNFYDVWFPNLSPSEPLLRAHFPIDDARQWRVFRRLFLAEMKQSGPARDLDLLAALSWRTDVSIGCYCEDPARCHRSLLQELLEARGAQMG